MKKSISVLVIVGLVLGVIGGIYFPSTMNSISFLGTIYVNLLKFLVIPIIATTIMTSIYNSTNNKTKLIRKTIIIFIVMFVTTFLLTSLIVVVLKPWLGFKFKNIDWSGSISKFNFADIIISLFPSNIITMVQNNLIFPTIIFSAFCGICATKIEDGESVIKVVEGFKGIFNKALEYIMYLTPIGVLSLIGTTISNHGASLIVMGAKYIGVAYLCSILVLILVMILPVCFFARISPIVCIKKIYKIWIVAATTCSSAATLPYTIKICNEELDIPQKITNTVVPLGCTIHMCGGAVSFALLGLFCSALFGIGINLFTYLLMLISAILINMAAPGIPNGGIVIGATYLSIFGIPLTFIGFYSGIYKMLDMSYTTLNVTGDITANIILNRFSKINVKEI